MKFIIVPIMIVIVIGIAIGASVYFQEDDYVKADVLEVEGVTIILGNGCKAIAADTTEERAIAIALGIEKEIFLRPTTYDNFADILKNYNITVDRINFEYYNGDFYYATIVLSDGKKIVSIDSKPSDAIALGLRMDAPIYVNKTLLNEIGINIC